MYNNCDISAVHSVFGDVLGIGCFAICPWYDKYQRPDMNERENLIIYYYKTVRCVWFDAILTSLTSPSLVVLASARCNEFDGRWPQATRSIYLF